MKRLCLLLKHLVLLSVNLDSSNQTIWRNHFVKLQYDHLHHLSMIDIVKHYILHGNYTVFYKKCYQSKYRPDYTSVFLKLVLYLGVYQWVCNLFHPFFITFTSQPYFGIYQRCWE